MIKPQRPGPRSVSMIGLADPTEDSITPKGEKDIEFVQAQVPSPRKGADIGEARGVC